jgi:hypothetical protein
MPAQVTPSGPPPVVSAAAPGLASATGGGVPPMMPPMMPPMGGVGAGSGGGPGQAPGAARQSPTGRRRGPDNPTPGLPALLSGKAGKANPQAIPARSRPSRSREADLPTTVELIDEDLWQVKEHADRPARIRRT